MKQGTQNWCSGTTQRDGMGREVGVEFRMGDTCAPMAASCRRMAKITKIIVIKVFKKLKKNTYLKLGE